MHPVFLATHEDDTVLGTFKDRLRQASGKPPAPASRRPVGRPGPCLRAASKPGWAKKSPGSGEYSPLSSSFSRSPPIGARAGRGAAWHVVAVGTIVEVRVAVSFLGLRPGSLARRSARAKEPVRPIGNQRVCALFPVGAVVAMVPAACIRHAACRGWAGHGGGGLLPSWSRTPRRPSPQRSRAGGRACMLAQVSHSACVM